MQEMHTINVENPPWAVGVMALNWWDSERNKAIKLRIHSLA